MKKYIVDTLGDQTITGNLSLDGNIDVQGSMNSNLVFNTTGDNVYVLQISDRGKVVEMNSSSSTSVSVPDESSVAFPDGTQILIVRGGTGDVQVTTGAGGISILSAQGYTRLNHQYSAATLLKKENNTWYLFGDLKP